MEKVGITGFRVKKGIILSTRKLLSMPGISLSHKIICDSRFLQKDTDYWRGVCHPVKNDLSEDNMALQSRRPGIYFDRLSLQTGTL
jgi:hypothetical protein